MTAQQPADRNLLFGILAVQMDFVRQEHLIQAMHAWVLNKHEALGAILVRQGDLSPDRRNLLEALVDEHLKQHNHDPAQSLAAVSSVTSARDALRQIEDQDVQASLAGLTKGRKSQPTQAAGGAADTISAGQPTISVNVQSLAGFRYQILRPHAKGGLGEVLVARDQELHREVALKRIQGDRADDPDSQTRFLMEAEITGGLEHPGIVPVYGLGHYADGRPYYAMKFIRGDSLKEAIARFHRKSPAEVEGSASALSAASTEPTAEPPAPGGPSTTERNLELRGLLGRFIDVCNAVAYAHSRGVLHRDLKPGNIMLGKYGETLVVDWGLAKPMAVKPQQDAIEPPLEPPSVSGSAETLMGSAVGTPQYMSPEQAAGRLNLLGPQSDVYSLGATLFCLLTGKAPFRGNDVGQVLKQVQHGDFPRPRQLDRRIAPPLEAICLRAMALEPSNRYASPRELAKDVENWLADEPIAAYRESGMEQATRWGRRHKPWVIAGALLLLTAVIGLTGSNLLINAERQRTQNALAETEESRRTAEAALKTANAAELARTEAQVEALLNSQPESVPTILHSLLPVRASILPSLKDQLSRGKLSPSQVMRVRLALLPDQPELVEPLREELLRAKPEEFAMLRAGLADHQAQLRDPLWRVLLDENAGEPRRFRAACALAAFDAENPQWAGLSDEVAGWLVHQNPLVLGEWVELLEPLRNRLLPALVQEFRDNQAPEIRSLVNNVIIDWADDQIDLLTDLLEDADPAQFASLLSSLVVRKDEALAKFRETLKSTLSPTWPKLATVFLNPEPKFAEQIEQAHGLITESFALVQTLPLEDAAPLALGLKSAGYRPIRFRPYVHRGQVLVAAVWQRDETPWRLETALTRADLIARDNAYRQEGFAPVEVAGYFLPDPAKPKDRAANSPPMDEDSQSQETSQQDAADDQNRFGGIWIPSDLKPEAVRLLCGLDYESYQKAQAEFERQSNNFGLLTLQSFPSADGSDLYSSVARVEPKNSAWRSAWSANEQSFEIMETPSWTQIDVSLLHKIERPPVYNPFERELALIGSDDQGTGFGQAYVRPFKEGLRALGVGENERAVEFLTEAIKIVQLLPQPYHLRAIAQARLGHAKEAQDDLKEGAAVLARAIPLLDAGYARQFVFYAAYSGASVSALLGEPEKGANALEEFIARHRTQAEALYVAARAYAVLAQIVSQQTAEKQTAQTALLVKQYQDRSIALLRDAFRHGFSDNLAVLHSQPEFAALYELPAYQQLVQEEHALRRYAPVWHRQNLTVESRRLDGMPVAEHREACRQLIAEGFRPAAISVSTPTLDDLIEPIPPEHQRAVAVSVWHRPLVRPEQHNELTRHKTNAALALWHLDPAADHWPLVKEAATPRFEAAFIDRCAALKLPPEHLISQLKTETHGPTRRMILLALGEFDTAQLPPVARQDLQTTLVSLYRDDTDPAMHSAAEWLLRKWSFEEPIAQLRSTLKTNRPREERGWYVNGEGQTLAVVNGPVEFLMGTLASDPDRQDDELHHLMRIKRSFAIATTETTVEQFLRYKPDFDYQKLSSPDANGPMVNLDWWDSVKYCRWLSEQEGIADDQMCYPPVEDIGPEMKLPANFLERTGYRLPTEAEWECAARAGTSSVYSVGDDPRFLNAYAWSKANAQDRAYQVGLLKPNRLGLFDVSGNVGEWCHDEYLNYPLPPSGQPRLDGPPLEVNGNRVGRGGSFLSNAPLLRSAHRFAWASNQKYRDVGLRIARTLPFAP